MKKLLYLFVVLVLVVVTSGTYEVVQLGSNYGTRFNNGQKLYVGAKITINGTGYLSFEP